MEGRGLHASHERRVKATLGVLRLPVSLSRVPGVVGPLTLSPEVASKMTQAMLRAEGPTSPGGGPTPCQVLKSALVSLGPLSVRDSHDPSAWNEL